MIRPVLHSNEIPIPTLKDLQLLQEVEHVHENIVDDWELSDTDFDSGNN